MAWVFLFCFYACSSAFAQLVETGGSFDAAQRLDLILQTIDASRLPALVGKDQWQHIVKRHQQPVLWSANQSEFHSRVNRMFDDAGISHFDYFGPSDFSLWHLRGAFPKVRIADGRVTHVGLFPEEHGGRWFVRGILEGSPASKAGILVGDEILTANGKPYEPFVHIADREGEPVRFVLARKEGEIYTTTMTPIRESLYHALQVAIMRSIRTEEFRGRKFAYVHVWTLLGKGKEFKQLLKMQKDVDGLLLDFRDGFGGTVPKARQFLLGTDRNPWPEKAKPSQCWIKPVVILTANGTRSAKELVVDEVKRRGRAPLIGEPTPGDVSAIDVRRLTPIGDDGLLMLPIHRFDLEGKPTMPDHLVVRSIPYCAGRDPQLELARELLASLIAS